MSVLSRYIVRHFLRVFVACTVAVVGLFVFINFFGQVGRYLNYNPRAVDLIAMFVLRIPHLFSELFPLACLFAVLISFGMLSRHRETMAMATCGISTWQIARPLLVLGAISCLAVLAWNEVVVPATSTQAHFIEDIVIKKKPFRGRFNATSVWLQSPEGFLNIDYYDANNKSVYGLTLYEIDPSFHLTRMVEVPAARWRNDRWEITEGSIKNFGPEGQVSARELEPGEFIFTAKPSELVSRRRRASDFSFKELRNRIAVLRARGLSTASFQVDLYEKLARPFAGLLMIILGLPIAIRSGRNTSLTYGLGIGMAVGFLYWTVDAVAVSAAKNGSLSPMLAAWAANVLFGTFGATFYVTWNGHRQS